MLGQIIRVRRSRGSLKKAGVQAPVRGVVRRWLASWEAVALVVAVVSTAYIAFQFIPSSLVENPVRIHFANCAGIAQSYCVVDGDTIRYEGVKVRIADIDTPEVFSPKCSSEKARGDRATRRMMQLLNEGPVELVRYDSRDADRYGRKLRVVERNGQSLGEVLVAEGLARRWDGARHSWCG